MGRAIPCTFKKAHDFTATKNGQMPIWRAVGGPPASAIKAGYAGVPMMLTTLGGPAINFKASVDAYREAAQRSGFDPATLPVATTESVLYSRTIHKTHYEICILTLMQGCQAFVGVAIQNNNLRNQRITRDALMVGSHSKLSKKCFTNMNLYGQQRFMAKLILVACHLIKL